MISCGVSIRGHGSAIVSAELGDEGHWLVTAIERHGFALDPLVARLRELFPDLPALGESARVVIDADALGRALWTVLDVDGHPGWALYEGRGSDRWALRDRLLVASQQRRLTFTPGLDEELAMKKALLGLPKDASEDGPDSELAVALSLALTLPAPEVLPWFVIGRARTGPSFG